MVSEEEVNNLKKRCKAKKYTPKKYLTQEGIDSINRKITNYIKFYIEKKPEDYPFSVMILGFIPQPMEVASKEELMGRITELANMIGLDADILRVEVSNDNS